MQYLLMLFADENAGSSIPADQMAKVMDNMAAYQAALTKAGAFVMTSPLARTSDARTIRMAGGDVQRIEDGEKLEFVRENADLSVKDGPYADTIEQLGGLYIIEAADMDEATQWAARCPAVQWGAIEIRAMMPGFEN